MRTLVMVLAGIAFAVFVGFAVLVMYPQNFQLTSRHSVIPYTQNLNINHMIYGNNNPYQEINIKSVPAYIEFENGNNYTFAFNTTFLLSTADVEYTVGGFVSFSQLNDTLFNNISSVMFKIVPNQNIVNSGNSKVTFKIIVSSYNASIIIPSSQYFSLSGTSIYEKNNNIYVYFTLQLYGVNKNSILEIPIGVNGNIEFVKIIVE
ncbi:MULTISPECIES: hypothetical protein [Acidianus]|uniref:Uncharacterized protein n=1 Tax=Candidatus Acidianus copahuensis TaxID=1160895 RepID=A0A031LKP2_9CREN|nr:MULTISPECIES: hypothetical protein [Acidianus]EZQ02126.1 hypothetical protein CM19_11495 [Candidatus Acidianus copahuensis]NON63282.1 hypothetical protein [Acidianus sp. RZ1]